MKKSKFDGFLDRIKTYEEKTTVEFFERGTSISTSSEAVFILNWSIPKWKNNIEEFGKYKFQIEMDILKNIFKKVDYLIPLTDDIWSILRNTDSYQIPSLEKVEKMTKKYGKDLNTLLNAIENKESIESPIIIKWGETDYELVCGNTRLMIASALGTIPAVMILEVL